MIGTMFGPLREEKIKMDPRCNTAVVGEPGFERQPIVYFLYLHIILALHGLIFTTENIRLATGSTA